MVCKLAGKALRKLTQQVQKPWQFTSDESQKSSTSLLARLAGTVVYSLQHLLEPAYGVTCGRPAAKQSRSNTRCPGSYWPKIQRHRRSQSARGWGKAESTPGAGRAGSLVEVDKRQVTLLVEECYAGRFKLTGVGHDADGLSGDFEVKEKLIDPTNPTAADVSV